MEISVSSEDRSLAATDAGIRERIRDFKIKLIWKLCTDLLVPPLPPIPPLKFPPNSTEFEKDEIRRAHKLKSDEREKLFKEREPELLGKLEDVMQRIVESRSESVVDNVEVWSGAAKMERQSVEFECDLCKNKDRRYFISDPHSGDTICGGQGGRGCGNVVQDHRVDEGSQFRVFADDEGKDRNHHGPTPDPLMPDSENMRTSLIGMGSLYKKLQQTHQYVETNLSTINTDDRRTKTAYRSNQKRMAFSLMEDVAANLNIHDAVVEKAKEEFARFRDIREHVISFSAVVAACLALSFEHLVLSNQLDTKEQAVTETLSEWIKIPEKMIMVKEATLSALRSEAANCVLADTPLKTWTTAELSTWLEAVFGKDSPHICRVLNHVSAVIAPTPISNVTQRLNAVNVTTNSVLGKRDVPEVPSFLGTTTMANRAKKLRLQRVVSVENSNAGPSPSISVVVANEKISETSISRVLSQLNIASALGDHEAAEKLKDALKTRLRYESLLVSLKAEKELEEKRLLQQLSNERLPVASRSERNEEIVVSQALVGDTKVGEEDDMLKMMLKANSGSTQLGSSMNARGSAASIGAVAAVKPRSVDIPLPKFVISKGGTDSGNSSNAPPRENYIHEGDRKFRMVKQIRVDVRTGATTDVFVKEEVFSEAEEDGYGEKVN